MKITLVNTQAPFVRGATEDLVDSLERKLTERGHHVHVVRLPFKRYPTQAIVEHMLACQLVEIGGGDPDRVIALQFPVYLVPYPQKRVWLLSQLRQAYELWGTSGTDIPDTPEGRRVRDMVRAADTAALGSAVKLFANSPAAARRLKTFNGIEAQDILFPPLDRPDLFGPGEAGDYFFHSSRRMTARRQHLAIEAMRYVRSPFRLVLAGRPATAEDGAELSASVERWGLRDRVQLLGEISEEEKARWMSGCLGALYLPCDEDACGYEPLEAFHSHKPVLTIEDSGDVMELLEHERNGLCVSPTAETLADGMERLRADRAAAREMGAEAHATLARHGIEWDHVLEQLTAA